MKKDDFLSICRNAAKKQLSQEDEAYLGVIGEAIERSLTLESTERNTEIERQLSKLVGSFDEGQNVASIIRSLGEKIDQVERKQTQRFTDSDKYKLRRALEAKKDDILAKVRRSENAKDWAIEFKAKRAASAMITTSTIVTGAPAINTDNFFDDVEVTVIRYPNNFILDAISSRQVSKVPQLWKWKEEIVAGVGVPAVTAEGDTKSLVDKKFVWKYSERKKYAGRIELTEETEIDFEQLTMDIIDMFESDVLRKYNAGVLTDILAWAPVYAGTALDETIVKPSLMNVVSAGQLQLQLENYLGDTLIINPTEYASTQNMQNSDGDPIFVPDNVLFPGLRLFVTNNIPAGTILLGEGSIIKEQHSSYMLRQGTYGTQFIENEKTIVGEMFSNLKLPTESKKGWVKLDYSTVYDALKKPMA